MDYREVNAAMRNWYDNKRQSLEFLGKSIIKNERNPLGDVRGFRLLSKAMVIFQFTQDRVASCLLS